MAPNTNMRKFQELEKFIAPAWGTILTAIWLVASLYVVLKGIYRVYFSPLAAFPGSGLAGATYLYEFYHTAIRADFPSKLRSLHKSYGQSQVYQIKVPSQV